MEARIIPHKLIVAYDTWWRVDVKRTVFRLGKFRIWLWVTVGDFASICSAKTVADAIKSLEDS